MPRYKGNDKPKVPVPVFPTVTAVRAYVDQVVDEGDECSRRLADAAVSVATAWESGGPAQRELHVLAGDVTAALAGEPDVIGMIKARVRAKRLGFHDPRGLLPSLYTDYARLGQESRRLR